MSFLRFLPTIKWEQQSIHLPCTEDELLKLAAALRAADELRELFAHSPAVLIYAANEYYDEHRSAPGSIGELAEWFLANQNGRLGKQLPGWSLGQSDWNDKKWPRKFVDAAQQFSIPPKNKKLRKSLAKLIQLLPNFDLRRGRDWMGHIIGKELNGTDLVLHREGHHGVADQSDVAETLINLAVKYNEQRSDFQSRLQLSKLNAMKQLAYGASHEINNPLANVATRAQSLLTGEISPERRRTLAVIYEQAMRAHEMISDMMLFAHPPKPTFELTDVYELIKLVVREMRPEIRKQGTMVDVRTYPDVQKIWLDATQIAVAIKALLKNSLESFESQSADDAGQVVFRIWPEQESRLAISITNNGPAVDRNAAEHLFDPFFSGREAGRGLGFGLSKAWRISQLHGGQLVWNRDFTDGAQFILRLPMTQSAASRIDNANAA